MDQDVVDRLVEAAQAVSENAYAKYSKFQVGAALLDEQGRVHVGCNVENASFGLSICAERSAVFAMVAAGGKRIVALALHTPTDEPSSPCGACRQVINEFGPGALVVRSCAKETRLSSSASDLLPQAFSLG